MTSLRMLSKLPTFIHCCGGERGLFPSPCRGPNESGRYSARTRHIFGNRCVSLQPVARGPPVTHYPVQRPARALLVHVPPGPYPSFHRIRYWLPGVFTGFVATMTKSDL